jgi:hypothetical protein
MFQVDRAENRLKKLEEKRFFDLQLREREHLQEWLANMPAALGEELLIIQKEFDGFDDTRERLDLLALDKEGQLVVIENKLDDTGRDVVWQAMKYAAYVSSLTKAQIVDIFQAYLDRWCGGGSAVELICEFLEEEALDEVVLNSGNSQRVVLIAANFRKEVTATALWLLGHGIRVQCFKVTPYAFGSELLLDVRQIIPVPEAAEYMIGMSSKDSEEKSAQGAQKSRHTRRMEFWTAALEALRASGVNLYDNISPTQDHWLHAGSGVSGCPYGLIFGKNEARVELNLSRALTEENKWLFDQLFAQKAEIEATFGAPLDWKRLDEKKSSRVEFGKEFDCYQRENWPEIIRWMIEHLQRLEAAFSGPLNRLGRSMRLPPKVAE